MKLCEKCGTEFRTCVKIDGKWRNLNHRKYCLDCSPFGGHNTRNLCKELSPCHKKTVDGKKIPYNEWSEIAKKDNRARTYWRGKTRKVKLVEMKGGKCQKCGYDKCLRSLSFHHRDRSDKKFQLDSRTIQSKSWDLIKKEVEKCDLLCLNCHMEEEGDSYNSIYDEYKDKYGKDID